MLLIILFYLRVVTIRAVRCPINAIAFCALGGSAAQSLLQTTQSLGKLRGRFHDYKGIPVLCTYHPAFLLPHRDPSKKKEVWEDMKLLMARMGRTLPERGKS